MNLLLLFLVVCAGILACWVLSGRHGQSVTRLSQLLWVIVGFFPMAATVLGGRSAYDQSAASWAERFVPLLFPIEAVGVIIALVLCFRGFRTLQLNMVFLVGAILFYGAAQVVSDMYNGSSLGTMIPTAALVVLLAVAVTGEGLETVKGRATRILRCYTWGSLATYIILPAWSVVPIWHEGRAFFGLSSRFVGLTPSPGYIGLIAAFSFMVEIFPMGKLRGWLPSAACAVGICVWSQGRTVIIVVMVALVVAYVARARSLRGLLVAVLAISSAGVGSLLVPAVGDSVFGVFGSDRAEALTSGRTDVWSIALREFSRSPWLGQGSSLFSSEYWERSAAQSGPNFANAHNQVLQALAQGGLLGLLALALLIWALIRLALDTRVATGWLSIAAVGALVAQLAFSTPLRISGFSVNLLCVAVCVGLMAGSEVSRGSPSSSSSDGRTMAPRSTRRGLDRLHGSSAKSLARGWK